MQGGRKIMTESIHSLGNGVQCLLTLVFDNTKNCPVVRALRLEVMLAWGNCLQDDGETRRCLVAGEREEEYEGRKEERGKKKMSGNENQKGLGGFCLWPVSFYRKLPELVSVLIFEQ